MARAECDAARQWSQRFERGGRGAVELDAAGSCLPRMGRLRAIEWDERTGRVGAVEYERHVHRRGDEVRRHEFRGDAAPKLSRTRAGHLRVAGGRYRVSSERGIVDMAKKKGGRKKAKKNIFRRGGSSGDRTMKFVENVATSGASGVSAALLTRLLLDRYTDWEPNTKAWLRAGGLLGLGLVLMKQVPRIAAGLATAGVWIAGEKIMDSLEVERRILEVLPARTTTTTTGTGTGTGTTTTTTGTTGTTTTTGGARGLGDGRRLVNVGGARESVHVHR